jgi:putative flavoprotein involved in K+ transport
MRTEIDVLIIGASQAGLAVAHCLKEKNISFLIIGKELNIGDVWRNRYDSLVLFTPRWYSSLPGLPLEGDLNGFATKNEIADYLERYAMHFNLPVCLNTEVYSLSKERETFVVKTNTAEYRAQYVIVATGPFQKPFIPRLADTLTDEVFQVHTSQYVNPTYLKEGPVLVVGAGNSGAQIAVELSKDREVYLSIGHKMKFFPLDILGKSIFWWFDKLGLLSANIHSKLGQFISKQGDPIFGRELKTLIREGKVTIKTRTKGTHHKLISFDDGSKVEVENVIWATGFHSDYSWIQIPGILNEKGKPSHTRGVSKVKGLYFLGLPWQNRRGSALIGGVGVDAKHIAENIIKS